MLRHAYIPILSILVQRIRCARHQHYFTFSTRCTLYNTYCQQMSKGQLLFFAYIWPTPSWKIVKKGKTEFKTAQIIHECLRGRGFFILYFCHILCCSLELPSYTYTCLLILRGKVGLALQVAVHNTHRVTSTRTPQPYM